MSISNQLPSTAVSSVKEDNTPANKHIARNELANEVCLEVTNCLISAGLVTNAINVLVAHKHTSSIDHIFKYLPADLETVTAATRKMVQVEINPATVASLAALVEKIDHGKTLVGQCKLFVGQCDDLQSDELKNLALCWQRVCAIGIVALSCLERSCSQFWSAEKFRKFDRLIELLANARDGQSPYLGADGYPIIPHWAEQRKHRRQAIYQSAEVHHDGAVHHARAIDLSAVGIGLERIFDVPQGGSVVVALADGRRFLGVVTWTAAGRAGIEFTDEQ